MRYKMSDVVIEIKEKEDHPSDSEYKCFVGLEHYVPGEIVIRNYGSTELLESSMKVFKRGDILVARRNVYLKRASVAFFEGLTSGDSIVLRAKDQRIGRMIPFVLNTDAFWDFADQHSDGTMSKRLSPKTLMEYEFDLPDKDDIDRISDTLWSAVETKEAYQKLIKKTDELIKSQFIEMFGEPNRDTAKWETAPFGQLTESFDKSRKPVKEGDRKQMQGPYPYYGATGIVDYVNDYRLDGTYLLISEDGKALEFRNYDIAFIASGKIWVNNHAHVVQCHDEISLNYLQYYFKYLDISSWVTGIDQKKLNRENLDTIPIMVPPKRLIDRFDLFVEQTDKSKLALKQAIRDIESMMKSIMLAG